MITNNTLEKSFGPVGSASGLFIFIAGFFVTFFISLIGLILILIGAFIGFTSESTFIDFDKKRVKLSNNIFGIIRIGHWINIVSGMKIGIKKSNKVWRAYSRTNQALDIPDNNFRLFLYDSTGKQILQMKKLDSYNSAKSELDSLSEQLGLSLI